MGLFGPDTREVERLIEMAKEEARRAAKEIEYLEERVKKWREYLYEDYRRFSRELKDEKEKHVFGMNAVAKKFYQEHRKGIAAEGERQLSRLRQKGQEIARELDIVMNKLSSSKEELKRLKEEQKALAREIKTATVEVRALGAQDASTHEKLDVAMRKIKALEAKVEELKKENKRLREENAELKEYVSASLREMAEMKRQVQLMLEGG